MHRDPDRRFRDVKEGRVNSAEYEHGPYYEGGQGEGGQGEGCL